MRRPQLARHIPPVVVQNQADIETVPAVTPSNTKVVRTRGFNYLASTVLKSQANALCTIQRGTDVIQQAASQEGPSKASSAVASAGCGGKRSPRELAASRSRRGAVLRSGARGVRRPQTPDTLTLYS